MSRLRASTHYSSARLVDFFTAVAATSNVSYALETGIATMIYFVLDGCSWP
jgi:hypothetical protein